MEDSDVFHAILKCRDTPDKDTFSLAAKYHLQAKSKECQIQSVRTLITLSLAISNESDCYELLLKLKSTSNKVAYEQINGFYRLLSSMNEKEHVDDTNIKRLSTHLLTLAIYCLNNRHYKIRQECILIIAEFSSIAEKGAIYTTDKVEKIFFNFLNDPDPRVRKTAILSWLKLYDRGHSPCISFFKTITQSLHDEDRDVRLATMQVIQLYTCLYPQQDVALTDSIQIKLINYAFFLICDMVNDTQVSIREKSCRMLGEFDDISMEFLLQTLDKKMLPDLKRQFLKSTTKVDSDFTVQTFHLEPLACGAFVHGFEDEYQQVRSSTIQSVAVLAKKSPEFARKSVDFLIDMLNDEIDDIRLQSVHCLLDFSTSLLTDAHIDAVLSNLDDARQEMRIAIRDFLTQVTIQDDPFLLRVIRSLYMNLKRYPQDRDSVFFAMKRLGLRSASRALPIQSLFQDHQGKIAFIDLLSSCLVIFVLSTGRADALAALPAAVKEALPAYQETWRAFLENASADTQKSTGPLRITSPVAARDRPLYVYDQFPLTIKFMLSDPRPSQSETTAISTQLSLYLPGFPTEPLLYDISGLSEKTVSVFLPQWPEQWELLVAAATTITDKTAQSPPRVETQQFTYTVIRRTP